MFTCCKAAAPEIAKLASRLAKDPAREADDANQQGLLQYAYEYDQMQTAMNVIKGCTINTIAPSTMMTFLNEKGIKEDDIERAYAAIYNTTYVLYGPTKIYEVDQITITEHERSFKEFASHKKMDCFKNAYLCKNVKVQNIDSEKVGHGDDENNDDTVIVTGGAGDDDQHKEHSHSGSPKGIVPDQDKKQNNINSEFWRNHVFVRADVISYKTALETDDNNDDFIPPKPEYLWKMKAYDVNEFAKHESLFMIEDKGTYFLTLNPDVMGKVDGSKWRRILDILTRFKTGMFYFKDIIFHGIFLYELRKTGNTNFFRSGLILLLCGVAIAYMYVCFAWYSPNYSLKSKVFLIPLLNVAVYKMSATPFDQSAAAVIDFILLFVVTFPLHLINLSYILQSANNYGTISTFLWLQMANSIWSGCSACIRSLAMFAEKYSYFDKGLILSIMDKFKITLILQATFIPIIFIEITQFFPFLFYYYVEIGDEMEGRREGLLTILFIFISAKSLFVADIWYHILFKVEKVNIGIKLGMMLFVAPFYIMSPLMPHVFMLIDKAESKRCQFEDHKNVFDKGIFSNMSKPYFVLVLYLVIAYGLSTWYIIHNSNFVALSVALKVALCCVLSLVIFVIATFPKLFYLLMKYTFKGLDEYEAYAQQAKSNGVFQNFYNCNK